MESVPVYILSVEADVEMMDLAYSSLKLVGIKDISMVYLLGVEGLDYPNAILVSLSDRSLQIGISMILGIFASLYFANINRKEGLNFINTSE